MKLKLKLCVNCKLYIMLNFGLFERKFQHGIKKRFDETVQNFFNGGGSVNCAHEVISALEQVLDRRHIEHPNWSGSELGEIGILKKSHQTRFIVICDGPQCIRK